MSSAIIRADKQEASILKKYNSILKYEEIEAFFIEINIKGNKWLICCSYNPNRIFVSRHLDHIAKGIDTYSKKYEKMMVLVHHLD